MRLRLPFLRLSLLGTLVLLAALFGTSSSTPAHATTTPACIQYGAFSKSMYYIVAQREGFFAQEGLSVCYNQVQGSIQQFDALFAGQYNIISTAADNVVNRVVNSNLPVEFVAGLDGGTGLDLGINTANGVHSMADLRGKPLAVDAPDSGFVFALRKILLTVGLDLNHGDYSLQIVGGGFQRFLALTTGHTTTGDLVYGTMLNNPLNIVAKNNPNVQLLAKFSDYLAPYQGAGIAVTKDYAKANGETLVKFIRAFIRAGQFATKAANRPTVLADVEAELGYSPTLADAVLTDAQDPVSGENAYAAVNYKGLVNTIALRQQFNGFTTAVNPKILALPGAGVYDARYWLIAAITAGLKVK